MTKIYRLLGLAAGAVIPLAIAMPGVASAAPAGTITGGSSVTARLTGLPAGVSCQMWAWAHPGPQSHSGVDGIPLGARGVASATGDLTLVSGPVADGTYGIDVNCAGGVTDPSMRDKTVYVGPLAGLWQFLDNSGSTSLTP